MATKSIIEIDVKTESVKFATDKTLTLKQQIVLLNKELQKLTDAGLAGSKKFQILSTALGDAEDKFAKSKAQSRDLLASLSLLPGPIGDFATSLNGSIGLLKTFTSFSLKDFGFQLKETANDFLDIAKNVLGLNVAEKEAVASKEAMAAAQDAVTTATEEAIVATEAETAAIEGETVATEAATAATITLGQAFKAIMIGALIAGIALLVTYWDDLKDAIMGTSDATRAYDEAEKKAIDNSTAQIVALDKLSKAVQKGGLTQREKNQAVNEYNKTLGETLGKVTSYIDLEKKLTDPKQVQLYKDMILQKAIAEGAYQLVVEKTKEKLKAMAQQAKETDSQAASFLQKLGAGAAAGEGVGVDYTKVTAEMGRANKKAILTEFDDIIAFFNEQMTKAQKKSNEAAEKAGLAIPKIEYTGETATKVDLQDKDFLKKKKEVEEELNQIKKTGEKERAHQELIDAGEREVREVEAMKVSKENEAKKVAVIANIRAIAQKKASESDAKFDAEEKQKQEQRDKEKADAVKKTVDLSIAAIKDQSEREKAEKKQAYEDTKLDLDKALKDGLIKQKEYDKALIDAATIRDNAIAEIDEKALKDAHDKKQKGYDDELKMLEVKGQALVQGTHAYYENRRKIIDVALEKDIDNLEETARIEKEAAEGNAAKILAIEKKLQDDILALRQKAAEDKKKITELEIKDWADYGSKVLNTVGELYAAQASALDEEAKTSEVAFERRKQFQLDSAKMSAAAALISIWAAPYALPPVLEIPLRILQSGLVIMKTNTQIDQIKNQKFGGSSATSESYGKAYGDGGMIDGPRHAQGGVMINAEGGEAVMTRGAVTMFGPLLSAINQAGGGTSFVPGAMGAARNDNPEVANNPLEPQILKTYVVENELTTAQIRQARLKNLSTL